MERTTIDYGIDLGTTNSSIALLADTIPEVVPNKEGALQTPSAIWFDKRGKQYVGKTAKDNFGNDEENAAVEFKLQMGQNRTKSFQTTGKQMLPEEMSAEVLKSLRADVRINKGEDLQAAVITVPAAFDLSQCDATRRAAELSGIALSPLLQEPVAAALAYGFQSVSDNVFWLVYDFGGGTFDAAVIQVRDGIVQVVNHAGDNYLGGKNVDWDIVEKLLVPRLKQQYGLRSCPDIHGSPDHRWRSMFAKIKISAEEAKIEVSRTGEALELWIEDLCADDSGTMIDFEYELTPSELEQITAPWIEQSIGLCRKALDETGLAGQDIEKIVLAGGSSLFPWLRDRLTDEFRIPLDFSIDPMTVVARGAAVFAGSQRIGAPARPPESGIYAIQLDYDPVGSDTEPMVAGKVTPPSGSSLGGLRVEIVELRSQWRSGSITLAEGGTFVTEVRAEKGRKCEYELILSDDTGRRLPCTPDHFAYTVGMVITSPPLTHNVGIAFANNESGWFFLKGDPLPVRAMKVFRTTISLQKNKPFHPVENVIRIPIIEGGNPKADRNLEMLAIEIRPDDPRVKRDVPRGSEIEVTVTLDASRNSTIEAFIPVLDETFDHHYNIITPTRSPEELKQELASELQRLRDLERRVDDAEGSQAHTVLDQLEREQVVETVQRKVSAAQGDPEVRAEAGKRLLDLKVAVDSVESALRWPSLVQEAREQVQSTREVVEAHGKASEKEKLKQLETNIEGAIGAERVEQLQALLENLQKLSAAVVLRQPEFWVEYLQYLEEQRESMRDQAAAKHLFAQCHRAISVDPCDFEALKAAIPQLLRLLPAEEREAVEIRGGFGSTIDKL